MLDFGLEKVTFCVDGVEVNGLAYGFQGFIIIFKIIELECGQLRNRDEITSLSYSSKNFFR